MGVSNGEDRRRLTGFTCRTKPRDQMEVRVAGTVEMKCGAKCGGPDAMIHLYKQSRSSVINNKSSIRHQPPTCIGRNLLVLQLKHHDSA